MARVYLICECYTYSLICRRIVGVAFLLRLHVTTASVQSGKVNVPVERLPLLKSLRQIRIGDPWHTKEHTIDFALGDELLCFIGSEPQVRPFARVLDERQVGSQHVVFRRTMNAWYAVCQVIETR